jgi:hypothetical protein
LDFDSIDQIPFSSNGKEYRKITVLTISLK